VCDEGVEWPIVDALRAEGHDVSYVAEPQPGISDDEVLGIAAADDAVVVTNDEKARIAARGIGGHRTELADAFTVIDGNRIRIRGPARWGPVKPRGVASRNNAVSGSGRLRRPPSQPASLPSELRWRCG